MSEQERSDYQANLDAWVASEGYPLEYFVADKFRSSGFRVFQGNHVRVASDDRPREIDVLASRDLKSEGTLIRCTSVVECKWSKDKPWVVFTSTSGHMANSAVIAQTVGNDLGDALLWICADYPALLSLPLFDAPDAPGFGGRQAFSKADTFYGAMASVTSAAVGLCREYAPRSTSKELPPLDYAIIVLPVIVVDGYLFEARYEPETEQIRTVQTNHVRCHWRGAPAWHLHATVDIVSREGVPDFVKQRRHDVDLFLQSLDSSMHLLRKAIASKDLSILNLGDEPRGRGGCALLRTLYESFAAKQPNQNS